MNPLTPLELLDIIEREHGFESPSIRLALTELEELKRYPTSDEVCLSIMKHYDSKIVFYNEMAKTFNEVHLTRNEEVVSKYTNGEVGINYNALPPHLITLIGLFYEGIGEE